jgi:hypothetical protein
VAEAVVGLDADLGALVAGTIAAYQSHWSGTLSYQSTELELSTPLRNPKLRLVTILDGIAVDSAGRLVVVEHKTTSSDMSPGSWYYEKLTLNRQASAYLWAARENGFPVEHVEWDVIKKPSLRRTATAIEPEYYSRAGKWGAVGDLKPGTGIPVESVAAFAKRVRDRMLAEPAAYFQRAPVVRMEDELESAIEDIEALGEQVITAWETSAWPQNPDSCRAYGQLCEYHPICSRAASPDDRKLYQLRTKRKEAP